MSRSYGSYDADWQRKKSVLIRSLFHDIPILSPVEEESNDKSQQYYVPTQEVFASPPRPFSPLPPLIIEKVPITNKHDEPEEYYSKLYKKMKRIYKKLFTEKRNFCSIDYGSNCSDSSVNEDSDGSAENLDFHFLGSNSPDNDNFDSIIGDREARQSSASTKSNGYGADFESMDTAIIDVVNYTPSNEDDIMRSDEEESDSENIDGDGISDEDSDNSKSCENKERIDDPEFSRGKECYHSIINDHEMTESEQSNEPENEQIYGKEGSDSENIDEREIIEETSKTEESDTVRIDDPVFRGVEESRHSSVDDHEKSESEESNEIEDESQQNNLIQSEKDSFDKELKSKEFEKTASEDGNKLIESNVELMEGDIETSDSSEGPTYRQITTAAMVHSDGSQDTGEQMSRVYEDSVKSVILPMRFGRVVVGRNVDVDDKIEVLQIFEDNADSKTTSSFYTDGSETTEEDYEEVATPQLKAKEEGIIKMRTPQAVGPEEDDEEMSSPLPDSAEEDVEEMESPQPAARDEETEAMEIPLREATEEDAEEMGTPRLDAPEEDNEEMMTPQPESAEEDVGGMESPESAARESETDQIGIPHPIEQMRTTRPDLSHGTIPMTHRSNSESTSEHTAAPQEPTALTSSTQDGADHNMSEIQTSNDMNEILTSIFNESRNKDGTPISGRKRKLVDKSVQAVQTSKVSWEEMRANFFVGTPKIFRLCACTDHICY